MSAFLAEEMLGEVLPSDMPELVDMFIGSRRPTSASFFVTPIAPRTLPRAGPSLAAQSHRRPLAAALLPPPRRRAAALRPPPPQP